MKKPWYLKETVENVIPHSSLRGQALPRNPTLISLGSDAESARNQIGSIHGRAMGPKQMSEVNNRRLLRGKFGLNLRLDKMSRSDWLRFRNPERETARDTATGTRETE